jgi:RAD51-like protein 3
MRLALFPFLPGDLVSSLQHIGIRTDSDILFSASTTDILQRLPPGTTTLRDLNNYIAQLTDKCAAIGVRGDTLLALEHEKKEQELDLDLGSGVEDLDTLLNGFGGSRVFEISGEKASGKTVSSNISL